MNAPGHYATREGSFAKKQFLKVELVRRSRREESARGAASLPVSHRTAAGAFVVFYLHSKLNCVKNSLRCAVT